MIINLSSVRVRIKVIDDNTGRKRELLGLVTKDGILLPLLLYLNERQTNGFSVSTMRRAVSSVRQLLEYLATNNLLSSEPKSIFQNFVRRSYEGTIGEDGIDPSGLYWLPTKADTTRHNLRELKNFLDWIAEHEDLTDADALPTNPSASAVLRFTAWFIENRYDFLTHTTYRTQRGKKEEFKSIRGARGCGHRSGDPLEFPEKNFTSFFAKGIGGSTDFRAALRDQLIITLLHGAGLRESEALSLWVHDVFTDPDDPTRALVRVYHPEEGKAPDNWRGRNGATHRAAYLLENFGLTPRTKLVGTQHLGWKGRKLDSNENFIQAHWFPTTYGQLFLTLWHDYMRVLASVPRDHPYAFVAFRKQSFGAPYTVAALHQNYKNALHRIGKRRNSGEGYSPHGHRHAYARRLMRANIQPVILQKCLHHSSLNSQIVYTSPSLGDVRHSLEQAMNDLDLPVKD